ncbi:MAG: outer membrane beta-barrel protein [Nitrospira sp.]|nr:porin [Nitrospira sp.]
MALQKVLRCWTIRIGWVILFWALIAPASAAEVISVPDSTTQTGNEARLWHYGAYLDVGYILNFNFPENHLWRNRATAARHNEFAPNMAYVYVKKDAVKSSRWGMELGIQGGYDSERFAFLQGEREVSGADTLRHIHSANISYLVPGEKLTLTAGLFESLIGYESLYANGPNNANYTRSWLADNTPYMMFGIKAAYQISTNLEVAAFVINRYAHLAYTNNQPSYGTRWSYQATPRLTLTQTLYGGPDQTNTGLQFWRFYANHIAEWKGDRLTVAASYDIGTENMADRPGHPRAFVTGGNVVARWHVTGPWTLAVRPEFYWDRNGRWTGSEQFVKAVTSTVEYRISCKRTDTILRLEHRWDESTGAGGGFFSRGALQPGVISLTPNQHLVLLGVLWTFDSGR